MKRCVACEVDDVSCRGRLKKTVQEVVDNNLQKFAFGQFSRLKVLNRFKSLWNVKP